MISTTSLVSQLKQCVTNRDLQQGKLLHSKAMECGSDNNIYVANTLISMYGKCGDVSRAQLVFERIKHPTVASWTALILGYVENGESTMALDLYKRMDCAPNRVTFVAALKACALSKENGLQKGVRIHGEARELGFDKDVLVAGTLIDMYSKCGDMTNARRVFDEMEHRTVVCWNILVFGYVENGNGTSALDVYDMMDCVPDCVTFAATLKACSTLVASKELEKESCLKRGMRIHNRVRELGLDRNVFVASALVDMYSKAGCMRLARDVFDRMDTRDVVTWNVLILGYVENGESSVAMELYNRMDCAPNHVTILVGLKACASLAMKKEMNKRRCLEDGVVIHKRASELGVDKDKAVGSTLIDMYSKCGDMPRARDVFDGLGEKDVVSWSILLFGYVENGLFHEALEVFYGMDCESDRLVLAAALKACGGLGALDSGKRIHELIRQLGWEQEEMMGTCLVDFYGRCGNMELAEDVFRRMHHRDAIAWTALVGGYGRVGNTSKVFALVEKMLESGLQLDGVLSLLILQACNHAGLVEEGESYLKETMVKHGVRRDAEHYACVVDMLGRANKLEEALSVVREMAPLKQTNSSVWMVLLGACRRWGNLGVGEVAFKALLDTKPDKESINTAYMLMGNIYKRHGICS